MMSSFQANAKEEKIFIGFGEIPFLSDSFKPSLGYGRKLDQLEDTLSRDSESFNADFGQDGLETSSEKTGYRAMLQGRYFSFDNPFYISLGVIIGGQDSEQMTFDSRVRRIGSSTYESSISVHLEREQSVVPAFGIGFSYPVSGRWYFTMAWLGSVPRPEVAITTSVSVSNSDLQQLESEITKNYEANFHNRYHLFNLGMEYRF